VGPWVLVQWLLSAEHAHLAAAAGAERAGAESAGAEDSQAMVQSTDSAVTKVKDLRLGRVIGVGAFGVVRVARHRQGGVS
jgi:hypothetical protein